MGSVAFGPWTRQHARLCGVGLFSLGKGLVNIVLRDDCLFNFGLDSAYCMIEMRIDGVIHVVLHLNPN